MVLIQYKKYTVPCYCPCKSFPNISLANEQETHWWTEIFLKRWSFEFLIMIFEMLQNILKNLAMLEGGARPFPEGAAAPLALSLATPLAAHIYMKG